MFKEYKEKSKGYVSRSGIANKNEFNFIGCLVQERGSIKDLFKNKEDIFCDEVSKLSLSNKVCDKELGGSRGVYFCADNFIRNLLLENNRNKNIERA